MQEFLVLLCCECDKFQVQLQKKKTKFTCSVCGFKQPYGRVYATSSKASDCRQLVSEYNLRAEEAAERLSDRSMLEQNINKKIVSIDHGLSWSSYRCQSDEVRVLECVES